MGTLNSKVAHDGARNAAIQASGMGPASPAWALLVDLSLLEPTPKKVKVDAVYYAISKDVEVQLSWEGSGEGDPAPLLSLEGRGRIDFAEVSGISNQAAVPTGNILYRVLGAKNNSMYTLILDLSKHIGEI